MTYMGTGATTMAMLYDDMDVNDTPERRRQNRRLALGGAVQTFRARQRMNVHAAAAQAGLAPMTLRRVEEGQRVRDASYAQTDDFLGLPVGTTKRALNDDELMVELMRRAGVDVDAEDNAAEVVARFAAQTAPAKAHPAVEPHHREALAACAQHVPAAATPLDYARELVRSIYGSEVPELRDVVAAVNRALPDLMALDLQQAEREIGPGQG